VRVVIPQQLTCFMSWFSASCPSSSHRFPLFVSEKICERPTKTIIEKGRALKQANSRKDGLIGIETKLERIMADLQMSMITDIRRAQGQVSRPNVSERTVSSSVAGESDAAGQVMLQLGRVRFNLLREDILGEVLGEGTFGVVTPGEYMGKEVAIKKARGPVLDPAVLSSFRCVCDSTSMAHRVMVKTLTMHWEIDM